MSAALLAAAVAVALAVGGRLAGLPLPATIVWLPAGLIGAAVAGLDLSHYLGDPIRDHRSIWLIPVAMALLTLAVGLLLAGRSSPSKRSERAGRPEHGSELRSALLLAVAAVGVFLCVPETDGLRLVVGPLLVAAIAPVVGLGRPWTAIEVFAAGQLLAWMVIVDGQSRGSAVIGASACIAAVGLTQAAWSPGGRSPGRHRTLRMSDLVAAAIHGAVVLVCSRVAGINPSTAFAIATAGAALVVGGVASIAAARTPALR